MVNKGIRFKIKGCLKLNLGRIVACVFVLGYGIVSLRVDAIMGKAKIFVLGGGGC